MALPSTLTATIGPKTVHIAALPVSSESGIFRLQQQAQATLHTASIRDSVKLPPGVGKEAWIAAQVLSIYQEVGYLVAVLEDMCTKSTCPVMCAGSRITYRWADDETPVPRQVSAPQYMWLLMKLAYSTLSDQTVIPQDGSPFPGSFVATISKLLRRFLRVYTHTYTSHFESMQKHGAVAHLNCGFKHFMWFTREFSLVGEEDFGPISALVKTFVAQGEKRLYADSVSRPPAVPEESPAPLAPEAKREEPAEPKEAEATGDPFGDEPPEIRNAWKLHVITRTDRFAKSATDLMASGQDKKRSEWTTSQFAHICAVLAGVRSALSAKGLCSSRRCPAICAGCMRGFYTKEAGEQREPVSPATFSKSTLVNAERELNWDLEGRKARKMSANFLRIFVHLLAAHHEDLALVGERARLIASFIHYCLFVKKAYLEPDTTAWPLTIVRLLEKLKLDLGLKEPQLHARRVGGPGLCGSG